MASIPGMADGRLFGLSTYVSTSDLLRDYQHQHRQSDCHQLRHHMQNNTEQLLRYMDQRMVNQMTAIPMSHCGLKKNQQVQ